MLASGTPEFPVRVTSIGTHNVHSDLTNPGTPEREVAEHMQLLAEFPSGYMITITCSSVNAKSPGFTIYTHKATLNIGSSGERIELVPEKEFADDIDPETMAGFNPKTFAFTRKTGLIAFVRDNKPMPTSTWPFASRRSFPWPKCRIA
jgi:predicted dehydrogenase